MIAKMQYDAEQIYKQVLINNQQQKENDIKDIQYQKIVKSQNNQYLMINPETDKRSGFIEVIGTSLYNNGYKQACEDYKVEKVKFYGINDEVQTKMCNSLNNQEFYIHDWNEFYRYDDSNKTVVKHRCYGLVQGVNLPPIDNHFHICRSYIKAIKPDLIEKADKKYSIFSSKIEKTIKHNYNINKAKLSGIDERVLKSILDNMEQVYEDFPEIKNKIKLIESIEHENGGMNIEPDLKDNKYIMQINKKFFGNEKIVQRQYNNDLKSGFHPKGTTYKDIGIHELGHSVTFEMIKSKYNNESDRANDWNKDITAKQIVQKAFTNLGVNDKLTKTILRNNISVYARRKYSETIGEAFADYYANKEKSNILSKEIIEVMKGMI